jgi:hypothetical protein
MPDGVRSLQTYDLKGSNINRDAKVENFGSDATSNPVWLDNDLAKHLQYVQRARTRRATTRYTPSTRLYPCRLYPLRFVPQFLGHEDHPIRTLDSKELRAQINKIEAASGFLRSQNRKHSLRIGCTLPGGCLASCFCYLVRSLGPAGIDYSLLVFFGCHVADGAPLAADDRIGSSGVTGEATFQSVGGSTPVTVQYAIRCFISAIPDSRSWEFMCLPWLKFIGEIGCNCVCNYDGSGVVSSTCSAHILCPGRHSPLRAGLSAFALSRALVAGRNRLETAALGKPQAEQGTRP